MSCLFPIKVSSFSIILKAETVLPFRLFELNFELRVRSSELSRCVRQVGKVVDRDVIKLCECYNVMKRDLLFAELIFVILLTGSSKCFGNVCLCHIVILSQIAKPLIIIQDGFPFRVNVKKL